jgi:hypothetical protein
MRMRGSRGGRPVCWEVNVEAGERRKRAVLLGLYYQERLMRVCAYIAVACASWWRLDQLCAME